jgi:putative flippase GtrA
MSKFFSPAFVQFIKYGLVGAVSTLIQMAVFYILASTILKCLTADDWAVRYFGLPISQETTSLSRGTLAVIANAIGFTVSNVFCWICNRLFVFKSGKFSPIVEFALFFSVAGAAMLISLAIMKILIDVFGMMTTLAFAINILISFSLNFVVRKFVIFKG